MTDSNSTPSKQCTKCKIEKPATLEFFHKHARGLHGVKSVCKTCASEYNRARKHQEYWADPDAARAKSAKFRAENYEKVVALRKASYYARRDAILAIRRERREIQKESINARRREDYANRAEIYRKRQRDDWAKNRDARSARNREYRKRNIEKIRAQERVSGLRKFYRRYGSDVAFTLKMRTSALLRASLRGGLKSKKTVELLGHPIEDLRAHLESQFKGGMTWERFMAGDIHIDHIRPVSSFQITSEDCEDFKKCWSLENLQPLWAEDNLRKGTRYDKP